MADDATALIAAQPKRFTWDEVVAMSRAGVFGAGDRVELAGGEIYVMPEEGPLHVWTLQVLQRWLLRSLPPALELAVRAPLHLDGGTVFVPDLALYPAGFTPVQMTPDNVRLIIEISDTTLNRDQRRKGPAYAAAGVAEFWIVDASRPGIILHTLPQADGWREVRHIASGRAAPSALPLAAFDLGSLTQR